MRIQRRFTRREDGPYSGMRFEKRVSEIRDANGAVIFRQENVTVPSPWSQIATDILAQKYFRRTGVPSEGGERDARRVFHRLAHTWTEWGRRYGYFDEEEDAQAFYDELCCMLARQMAAPNSPQWFNTGLYAVYGIEGPPQGHYYVDPADGELKRATSAYERPQPHACQPYRAPVSTPEGPLPIGAIARRRLLGLEVCDGTERGRTRVVAVAENGTRPVFRVRLGSCGTLEATADHLVLASVDGEGEGRWVPVEALSAGMRLYRAAPVPQAAAPAMAPAVAVAAAGSTPAARLHPPGASTPAAPLRSDPLNRLLAEPILGIEELGPMPVYDIQTESGQYLSGGIVVHNCFIISVQDDLVNEGGIMDLVTAEARLFKYGSGTGTNYSRLRARQEPLSGGGVSSGLLSFLKVGDRSASAIKSGGTTRRAARMITLDADHPDVEQYIDWKVQEEQKVVAMVAGSRLLNRHARQLENAVSAGGASGEGAFDLGRNPALREAVRRALAEQLPAGYVYRMLLLLRQGFRGLQVTEYTTDWDEEAYATVSGQSSNNSVRLDGSFMRAVLEDGEWTLTGRVDPSLRITVKARHIWDGIASAAWSCADPGIQFHSTINEWHTCPADGEIRASNPCSEYMFLDDTACNLASLNLLRFYDQEEGRFDVEGLRHAVHLWTMVLEMSVLMAQFPTRAIARNSYDYRTLGLGFANLGSLLMVMGIPYDSERGRAIAACLSALIAGQAYLSSAQMAAALGPFPRFAANREHMLRVVRNHRRAIQGAPQEEYEGLSVFPRHLDEEACPPELLQAARAAWEEALAQGEAHGFRNAQVTAIAPTGTIGLVMDCDTTGVEPDFALVKLKKLAGGGHFKIINSSIPPALRRLGYSSEQVEEITAYCLGHGTLKGAPGVSWTELKKRGFTEAALKRAEKALQGAFSIHQAFTPAVLQAGFLEKTLGISPEMFRRPRFRLLEQLGFGEEQIEAAETFACGTMNLEGAPHLKAEHLPVFDTASRAGRRGTRFIPWRAHVEMMAAVQPFVSGAISKTVNMPVTTTVEEIKSAYLLSWQRMLKAIAVYRDGSKLSQPLSSLTGSEDALAAQLLAVERELRSSAEGERSPPRPPAQPPPSSAQLSAPRTNRRPLPGRRNGYTQKAKIGGHSLFVRTGEYPDGSLGEIFLDMHREGAAFRSLLNSFAIAVSLGLQYGVPLEEYVDAFVFTRFEPNGVVQGHENIKITTSVLDFIFRDLALSYLRRTDLVQVKPDDLIATSTNGAREGEEPEGRGRGRTGGPGARRGAARTPAPEEGRAPAERPGETADSGDLTVTARLQGYEGDPCPVCGNLTMVRNGTCLKCLTCGSTTGCS
jgi:ribonucleoside-diphosphate reductase alpha chain